MALSNLAGWKNELDTAPVSACGATDQPEEKPTACGSACGAGDQAEEQPTACGAGDK